MDPKWIKKIVKSTFVVLPALCERLLYRFHFDYKLQTKSVRTEKLHITLSYKKKLIKYVEIDIYYFALTMDPVLQSWSIPEFFHQSCNPTSLSQDCVRESGKQMDEMDGCLHQFYIPCPKILK